MFFDAPPKAPTPSASASELPGVTRPPPPPPRSWVWVRVTVQIIMLKKTATRDAAKKKVFQKKHKGRRNFIQDLNLELIFNEYPLPGNWSRITYILQKRYPGYVYFYFFCSFYLNRETFSVLKLLNCWYSNCFIKNHLISFLIYRQSWRMEGRVHRDWKRIFRQGLQREHGW